METQKAEPLCTVTFPGHVNVAGPRERKTKTQTIGGKNLSPQGEETILKKVPLSKALKHATYSGAAVIGPDGEEIAKPAVVVADRRPEAADERAKALSVENEELRSRLDALEARVMTDVPKAKAPNPRGRGK